MSDAHDPVSGASTKAMFQAVVLTAFLDGRDGINEADVVREHLALDPRFGGIGEALGFELGVQARVALNDLGIEEALEKIVGPITDKGDQQLTFRLCARAMVADGKTEGDEAMVLGTLQERFAMQHADVVAILEAERKRQAAT